MAFQLDGSARSRVARLLSLSRGSVSLKSKHGLKLASNCHGTTLHVLGLVQSAVPEFVSPFKAKRVFADNLVETPRDGVAAAFYLNTREAGLVLLHSCVLLGKGKVFHQSGARGFEVSTLAKTLVEFKTRFSGPIVVKKYVHR